MGLGGLRGGHGGGEGGGGLGLGGGGGGAGGSGGSAGGEGGGGNVSLVTKLSVPMILAGLLGEGTQGMVRRGQPTDGKERAPKGW